MKPKYLPFGASFLPLKKPRFEDILALTLLSFVLSASAAGPSVNSRTLTLAEARKGFATHLIIRESAGFPVPTPPPDQLELVNYTSPVGELPAYVSRATADGKKYPAIIWIVGGFSNSISELAWSPGPVTNDQSATIFRQKGIITMYPSLRGGNENPGFFEDSYGEVDDVLAAADYLAKQTDVDPQRIYLGGHSTGGTLALLVAECSSRFRAIFCFGPVDNILDYGADHIFYTFDDKKESLLRSPGHWLDSIHAPTFVFEGTKPPSNIAPLHKMSKSNHNPAVNFLEVENQTHFTDIRPVSALIADKILQDIGPSVSINFTKQEIEGAFNAQ